MKRAREMGADDVICTMARDDTRQIRFANNSITASKSWMSNDIGIYLVRDKRILATEVSDPALLDKTLDDIIKRTSMMPQNPEYGGIAKGPHKYRKNVVDMSIAGMVEELYDHVDAAITAAQSAGASRVAGVLYSSASKVHMATSGGNHGNYASSSVEISVRAMTAQDSSGHMVQSATGPKRLKPGKIGQTAGELATDSINPEIGREGKFDVVFSPMIFSNILDSVGSSCSAGAVDAGLSFLKDMIGKPVASEHVTVFDDGTNPESVGSMPFDEEGVPTRRNLLIEKGILKGYLHNTSTAKRYNTVSTGNAGMVFPQPWTVCLEPGQDSREGLISKVDNGYYMTNTWYTRFQNYQTGDFSTIPRDAIFLIKNGKLDGPVKDIRISENMVNIMKNIKAVGNDPMQVHWWEVETPVFSPHVLVENVNITKSTQ
ncbi:MAG: TldD/PmbA family protein [Euryarchaeota archaeon]|nr:TldD/PmbA family protein [Euryarchaeota archaeon]